MSTTRTNSTQSKVKFALASGRSAITERAMRVANSFERTAQWPNKGRKGSRSSSGSGSPRPTRRCNWHWLLACLLVALCSAGALGHPTRHNTRAQQSKQQLFSRYNFSCIQPNDAYQHEAFRNHMDTANSSLTDLKNDLNYIMGLAQHLKFHQLTNATNGNTDYELIPTLPTPGPIGQKVTYQDAFNRANNKLIHYLNGLENIAISLTTSALLGGDRLNNLTDIQTQLADWLHKLHMRMVQQKMDINCDGIREALKANRTIIPRNIQDIYLSSLMRKFINMMEHVMGMFDKAIENENEIDRKKKADEKNGKEWSDKLTKWNYAKRSSVAHRPSTGFPLRHRHHHRHMESMTPWEV